VRKNALAEAISSIVHFPAALMLTNVQYLDAEFFVLRGRNDPFVKRSSSSASELVEQDWLVRLEVRQSSNFFV
jgi:hypothetical protein